MNQFGTVTKYKNHTPDFFITHQPNKKSKGDVFKILMREDFFSSKDSYQYDQSYYDNFLISLKKCRANNTPQIKSQSKRKYHSPKMNKINRLIKCENKSTVNHIGPNKIYLEDLKNNLKKKKLNIHNESSFKNTCKQTKSIQNIVLPISTMNTNINTSCNIINLKVKNHKMLCCIPLF